MTTRFWSISKTAALRLSLVLASGAVALISVEVLVRLANPQQLILVRPDIWIPCKGLGWCMAPNLDTRVNTGEREVRLVTDRLGHRVAHRVPDSPNARVLAIGDSFLVGIQVDYDDLTTSHLEGSLSSQMGQPVAVVNTGVGGWGPSHYLIKVRSEIRRQVYDVVLVFLYVGNDVEEFQRGEFSKKGKSNRDTLRLPESLSRRAVVDAWGYPINNFFERRSHLFVLTKNRLWSLLMRAGLSARYFPEVFLLAESGSARWNLTLETCREIDAVGKGIGVPVIFVLLPAVMQVVPDLAAQYASAAGFDQREIDIEQPTRLLVEPMRASGLLVIDTLPQLRRAHASGQSELFGNVDTHLGPAGHAVIAETILADSDFAAAIAGPDGSSMIKVRHP